MPRFHLEQVLYGNFIKYTSLRKLTEECFVGSTAEHVNIMIDLNSVFSSAYGNNIDNDNPMIFAATAINLCAHLRNYYRRTHRVTTSFFLVYNYGNSESNRKFYHNFNSGFLKRISQYPNVTKTINANLDLLKTLIKYIPNVYLVCKDIESYIIMDYLHLWLENKNDISPVIAISKDPFAMMIPSTHSDSVVFRPSKYQGQDVSYAITNKNVISKYFDYCEYYNYDKFVINKINPALLSLIIALQGNKYHSVEKIYNSRMTLNNVLDALDNLKIPNMHINSANNLNDIFKTSGKNDLCSRYKAIDMLYQTILFLNSPEASDNSFYIDLSDPQAIKQINEQYFIRYGLPLDLENL